MTALISHDLAEGEARPPGFAAPPPRSRSARRARSERLLEQLAETTRADDRQWLRDELVALNLDVVESLVARYRNRGIDHDDLVQVASLGLVKAIDGFDPGAGHAFLSYAVPTIRGEVMRYFRDSAWTVRPPRSVQELQPRIRAAREQLTHELGRSPRPTDIAEHLEVGLEEVIDAMSADGCFTPTSLDTPYGADDAPAPVDLLGGADPGLKAADARLVLAPALRELAPRDREILYLRFFEGLQQREIGERLGISQMQVSRILARLMRQLREEIESSTVDTELEKV